MITFVLEKKSSTFLVYKYYPENHMESNPGTITVDVKNGKITLDIVAEEDFLCSTSADELNMMRDKINELRIENGELPLTEEELPVAENDEKWYQYANHAMNRIHDEVTNGRIPEQGKVAWY